MPIRIHKLIRVIALCAEMVIHAGLFALIAAAMFAEKAGVYGVLQFWMDVAVMSTILALMFFKYMHEDAEPSRVPDITCFSVILSLSLTGAMGLAIRATFENGFCEEFLSAHPEKCREAELAIAMSWTSVIIAVAGILVSWLDKYPGVVEVSKFYALQRSAGEIELLKQQPPLKPMNASPRIYIPRPPPASYAASQPRGPRQLVLPQTLPGYSQRVPSQRVPSYLCPSPTRRTNEPASLILHREVRGPVGQAPRNQPTLMRIDGLKTPPDNLTPIRWSTQKVDGKDMWKQKFLV